MRVAAIDLGTNSFLCLIAEVAEGTTGAAAGSSGTRTLKKIYDISRVVRLGEKVHTNRFFLPEALKRAEVALDEFQKVIREYPVDKVIATATSAARDATNGEALMKLGRDRGIPIYVIEGSREAELSFEGAISGISNAAQKKILVIDVGGGSTEFIFREPGQKPKARSFDVGCVRLTEMFLKKDPVEGKELIELSVFAGKTFSAYGQVDPELIVAVAGTPTTLACVAQSLDFDESKVEGYVLTREEILGLMKKLGSMPLEERKKVKGLEPLRADVIVAGGALLAAGLDVAQKNKIQNQMRVSTRGLRYGVALFHEEFP